MNLLKKTHRSQFAVVMTIFLLSTFGCSFEDDPILAPNELTVADVATAIVKHKIGESNDGFIKKVSYHNHNTIKIESSDYRAYYYQLDDTGEVYHLTFDQTESETIRNEKSASSKAGRLNVCGRSFSSGGLNFQASIQCNFTTCYLHVDRVDAQGNVTVADQSPSPMGSSLNVFHLCAALALMDL